MQCKKVQDELMTRYLDKELEGGKSAEVEQHLTACPNCREFFETVRETAVLPFQIAGEMQPEISVWQGIQERIEAGRSRSRSWFGRFTDVLVFFSSVPQPVFRTALVTALILVAVVATHWPFRSADPVYGYLAEQLTFMNELKAGNTDLMNGDLGDYESVFGKLAG